MPEFFPGREEERRISAVVNLGQKHGAAERGAEFVAHQVRCFGEGVLALPGYAEAAVAAGFEYRTMHLVGAALGDHHGAGGPRQLGARYRRFDAGLLDRVQSPPARTNAARVAVPPGYTLLQDVPGGVAHPVNPRVAWSPLPSPPPT